MIKLHRSILTTFTITCLLFMLFPMGCKVSVKADTTIWTVDDDDGSAIFSSIQEAIDSPDVNDGDTISVRPGIYPENLIVNKRVSLIGEDRDSTIVDGERNGSVITIEADNVSIMGFTIKRSRMVAGGRGIFVDHSSGNNISHNTITNNYDGISLYESSNNVVSGNTISSNNQDGISFYYYSSNNVVSGNTISSNRNGISFVFSGSNIISGNTITINHDGISFYSSGNNVVSGNTITNHIYYGMKLALSKNNIIYRNNFNNTFQVQSDQTSTNFWDNGNEGNYWSDYNGTDANQDGIGDTPYGLDESIDRFPLMGMFSDFLVICKEETYRVTTVCNSTISDFRFEIGQETGNKIMRFNVAGKDDTVGFCRIMIPTELMSYQYIILVDDEEILPTLLEDISNEMHVHLYFIYKYSSHTITIISSLARKLEADLYILNATYHTLLGNYSELQQSYQELNKSYQEHLINYSELQQSYQELNDAYQEYLLIYSKNVHNIRTLMYIFAATTAIFLIITIYLSKRAHGISTIFGEKALDRSESRD